MTASRWSIDNVLRQSRGARNATSRAVVKHGRNALAVAELRQALKLLAAVEARLLAARRRVRHGATRRAA